jgi:hypothetical protein
MTFSELVLLARQRLHDYRDRNGSIITDATVDGIRWTSVDIQTLSKGALQEMLRTLRALKLENHINQAVQTQIVPVKLATSGLVTDIGTFIKITCIQPQSVTNGLKNIYYPVSPEEFFSKKYRTYDSSNEGIEDKVFTVIYDITTKEFQVRYFPILVEEVEASAIVYKGLDAFYTMTETASLPFIEVDDLILDYIEKNGRSIEHSPEQSKEITQRIVNKLGELKIENSQNN